MGLHSSPFRKLAAVVGLSLALLAASTQKSGATSTCCATCLNFFDTCVQGCNGNHACFVVCDMDLPKCRADCGGC
jgi:hypothetical protein